MPKVQILPENMIKRIAAGEVIERPASVLKELIENSLDAEATSIHIEVKGAGRLLLRIADNGAGMSKEDLLLCFKRHATSKISLLDDLDNIHSLGFRGEALYAIGAVSRLNIQSSQRESKLGHRVLIHGARLLECKEAPALDGTIVEVQDLFYNTPARLKFLKSQQTELSHLYTVVKSYALAYPHVSFCLTNGKKDIVRFEKNESQESRAKAMLGIDIEDALVAIHHDADGIGIQGYVGVPELSRKDRSCQFFYVNNRPVKTPTLSYCLSNAFHSLLPHDRFPMGVISVRISPSEIDVNVHPTKREIKFRQAQLIQQQITAVIRSNLQRAFPGYGGVVSLGERPGDLKASGKFTQDHYQGRVQEAVAGYYKGTGLDHAKPFQSPSFPLGDGSARTRNLEINLGHTSQNQKQSFELLCVIEDLFWIIRVDDGFALVDQHAAHERVLYERYLFAWKERKIDAQNLLVPIVLDLGLEEHALLTEYQDCFLQLGFGLNAFGSDCFALASIPAYIETADCKKIVLDMLDEIRSGGSSDKSESSLEDKLMLRACKSAVKGRDALNALEMEQLLVDLFQCRLPYTCPHGRPTLLRYTVKDLYRIFKRA